MDFPQLRAFVTVAEFGSVSRAAEKLHLTQPSISKRLAALERQLKQPLFDRIGRRMKLTDAGRAFHDHADRVLKQMEDARRSLSHLTDVVDGRLTIGTSHHIGLHRLPTVLRRYTQRFPHVDLDIHFMDSEVACEAVLAGKLELGIVTLPAQALPNLLSRVVWDDPLDVVVSGDHPLAQRKTVRLKDLAGHPAVLPDEATYTHRIIKSALQRHGLTPRIRLSTNYLETLKMLTRINLGWSVLPRSMLGRGLHVLKLKELRLHRELGAVWHRQRTLSAAAGALLEMLPKR